MNREILEDLKWNFEDTLARSLDRVDFMLEDDDEIQLWLSVAEIKALLELIKKEVS